MRSNWLKHFYFSLVQIFFLGHMIEMAGIVCGIESIISKWFNSRALMKLFMMKQPMLAFSSCFELLQQNFHSVLFDLAWSM